MPEHLAHYHKKRSEEGKARYETNPRFCKECGKIIPYKRALQKNTFCDKSCSATNSNKKRSKKSTTRDVTCSLCGDTFSASRRGKATKCYICRRVQRTIRLKTKGELFSAAATWQSARSSIRDDAHRAYLESTKSPHCAVADCLYVNHIEVAHIKSVSSFTDDVLVSVINDLQNLVGLCPNHHWDFDHGLLVL